MGTHAGWPRVPTEEVVTPDSLGSASRRHILVVDDDDSIRALLADALTDEGYTVEAAGTTDAALAAVAHRPPDAIVLDMRMPNDGPQFKAELIRRSLHAPIVAMSATIDGRQWAQTMGVPFVGKPFELEDVSSALRLVLSEAQASG